MHTLLLFLLTCCHTVKLYVSRNDTPYICTVVYALSLDLKNLKRLC